MIDIMIIEDHGIVHAGISILLGSISDIHVIAAAENAQEALSLLKAADLPDVILTDLHLNIC
ncbi:response regulator [Pedobacter sp. JY14-1]|uniref:response regulator transcription factor n=1 Tax=Pedobacter sp. JY14-1 TaxID=3034151 RepID=UPI0023E0CA01|nr:response regulator [Pedobacter sp. JY14-1]